MTYDADDTEGTIKQLAEGIEDIKLLGPKAGVPQR